MASAVAASVPQVSVELPPHKGVAGWEFTPIDKLDLAKFPIAPAAAGATAGLFSPEDAIVASEGDASRA